MSKIFCQKTETFMMCDVSPLQSHQVNYMWLRSIHSCFQGYKNYKNRPRYARVIVENKVVPFTGQNVHIKYTMCHHNSSPARPVSTSICLLSGFSELSAKSSLSPFCFDFFPTTHIPTINRLKCCCVVLNGS